MSAHSPLPQHRVPAAARRGSPPWESLGVQPRAAIDPSEGIESGRSIVALIDQSPDVAGALLAFVEGDMLYADLLGPRAATIATPTLRWPVPRWLGSASSGPLVAAASTYGAVVTDWPAVDALAVLIVVAGRAEAARVEALVRYGTTALTELAAQRRRLTQLSDAVATLSRQATTDPLTGVANLRALTDRIALESDRARRRSASIGVIVADLDGLKAHNDRYGHAAGDRLLQRTAQALSSVARATDLVARVGGDEFVVLAPATRSIGLRTLLERVEAALAEHGLAVSLGAACGPADGGAHAAWQSADRQMYRTKRAHRASRPTDRITA
jgi:diguanylate cyclase (GGDEF)-like protein